MLIHRYFSGNLTEEEQAAFAQRLEVDEGFAALVAEEAVRHQARFALKSELEEVREAAFPAAEPDKPTSRFPVWRVAAALALVLLLVPAVYWINTTMRTQPVQAFFEPYRGTPNLRDGAPVFGGQWEQAMHAYRDGQYALAEPLLAAALQGDSLLKAHADFYRAQCFLANDPPDYAQAIPLLKHGVEAANSIYREQAQWYLALAYHGAGNPVDAGTLFQEIATDDRHYQQANARQILAAHY
ncbi:MAG: hypothetical protein AAGB22_01775 [Bacteroidota bacterium]